MKKRSFFIAVLVLCISFFYSNSFAQPETGGSASGGGSSVTLQPSPLTFKRNNGNGTCGGEAEIRVLFATLPDELPTIAQVSSNTRDVTGIVIDNVDASTFPQKGYVSYCISSADILPAVRLSVRFHYEKSHQDFWIEESYHSNGDRN